MKILHVYSGNLFGGVERMLVSTATLEGNEFQHSFALCFEGRLAQALRDQGAPLTILPAARIKRPLTVLRTRSALRELLRERAFDVVICHGVWSYCVFAPAVVASKSDPVLFLHDAPEPWSMYYRWAWLAPPKLCLVNSAYIAGLTTRMRPRVRVEIVHPLVPEPPRADAQQVFALRAQLGVGTDGLVILQASRLDPWKGHLNLLVALHGLRDLHGWTCWIAGSPQRPQEEAYRLELLARVDALGLSDRVQFIGHRDDMEVVLEACDIYCQPNETPEPFGMVFVEALFAGKPVVGSASGGTMDIVDPECGILCAPGSQNLLAALSALLRDGALRARMSSHGPARARAVCGSAHFSSRLKEALLGLSPRLSGPG